MQLLSYVGRRLLQMVPVAIGVTILVFFMVHLLPGDPARYVLGLHADPQRVALLHQQWGLNHPLWTQYIDFMGRLFRGNLGDSLIYGTSALTLIFDTIAPTIWLLCYGAFLAVLIAVPLAAIAASKRNALRDHAIRVVPLVGLGFPPFWIGIIFILVIALNSGGFFPVSGFGSGFVGHLKSMFLPSLTVAVAIAPLLIRSLRASLLGVLEADYITTARSKGVSERRVLYRHALRNAIISMVTVLGINIGFLVGGTLVVEQVFAIPGIGHLMINAIFERDFPVVQGVTLVFAIIVVLVYLATDVVHALLDPRVRFD